jgi:hypothetical protein
VATKIEDDGGDGKGFAGLSSLLPDPDTTIASETGPSVPDTAITEAGPARQKSHGAWLGLGTVAALFGLVVVVAVSDNPASDTVAKPVAGAQTPVPTPRAPATVGPAVVVPATELSPARELLKPTSRCLLATWRGRTFIGTEGWQVPSTGIRLLDGSEVTLTSSAKFFDSAPCSCRVAAPGRECSAGRLDESESSSRVEVLRPTPSARPEPTVSQTMPSPTPATRPVRDLAAFTGAAEYVRAEAGAMCVAVVVGDDRVILMSGLHRDRATGNVTIGGETFERPRLEMDVSCACRRWLAERGSWYRCTGQ